MFRHKTGPLFTRGRFQHAFFGLAATIVPGILFGSAGWAGVGLLVTWVFALAWEASTPLLVKLFKLRWGHPFGDAFDLFAYLIGGSVGYAVVFEIIS